MQVFLSHGSTLDYAYLMAVQIILELDLFFKALNWSFQFLINAKIKILILSPMHASN